MGLFDFLKPKDKPVERLSQLKADRPECDIAKTQTIVDLFQTPQEQRDDNWYQSFYNNIETASFACGSPQTFTGPDGFPYFSLLTPEPNKPFESFCIRNMKDDFLLDKGLGVAINPGENAADWAFSYGDIVNLHLNKEFFTSGQRVELQSEEIIKKDVPILVAQPSESYLPMQTRHALKSFLQKKGIKRPKVMLVCRTVNGEVIQELAFNVFREDLKSTEDINYFLQQISWFLPRHYIILSVPKKSDLARDFADL